MTFTAIRNAAASRLTITDGNGKVLSSSDLGEVSSAFYSSSDATWISTRYTLNMGDTPNAADGTYLNVDLTLAPEYYASYDKDGNATVDWDALSDGATMHYGMVVDKTAPTVSNVNLGTDAEGNKVLTFTAGDDQYMSAVALLDYDKGSVVSKAAGSPEGAAKGASQNFTLSLGDSTATHLLLQVYDYAENYVTYKLNLNPDELAGDVTVKLNTEARPSSRATSPSSPPAWSPSAYSRHRDLVLRQHRRGHRQRQWSRHRCGQGYCQHHCHLREGSLRQRHLRGHSQGGGGHPERRSAGCQGQG